MMNEAFAECRVLPAINETFPQFSARPPILEHQQHQHLPPATSLQPPLVPLPQTISHQQRQITPVNNLIISPLDLSLRAGVNIVPITPPSTPSPPRKRSRFMTEEQQHFLWRPHVMGTTTPQTQEGTSTTNNPTRSPKRGMATAESHNYFTSTYTRGREELPSFTMQDDNEGYETLTQQTFAERNNANTLPGTGDGEAGNTFAEISKSQRSVMIRMDEYRQQPQQLPSMPTIYVDDETIVLTEDEDDDEDNDNNREEDEVNNVAEEVKENDDDEEIDEENETLVSSQELNEDVETNEVQHNHSHATLSSPNSSHHSSSEPRYSQRNQTNGTEEDEDEEYVDILSNDDDDINPLSNKAITMLRLQSQAELEQELAKSGQVLTRNKLVYENEELHNRAVDGLAKLFDRDFQKERNSNNDSSANNAKTYIDLTNCTKPTTENPYATVTHMDAAAATQDKQEIMITPNHVPNSNSSHIRPPYKTHKTERKRMKLRKHMSLDEETISPVSGTIIRKLRDDEELVVRKGDIDPAFNVVEVTEEAKAILASIDNKIGAYLCQLCRTLYDDAFKLAQHRCPRIVHIEYKCSECEKVFNCPANLASHRRWHKPKSELLANSQAKKRQHAERLPSSVRHSPDKNLNDDGIDGIYPCNQCGKTFRRQAYLKKHQTSHQMLENLKSLDIFKHSATNSGNLHHPPVGSHLNAALHPPSRLPNTPLYPPMIPPRPYTATRFGTFPFGAPFDHRRFYTLGEFYLSQQLERSSAFQYVQANHLRNLSNVAAGNFGNRPTPLVPLPVK
ncbi:nervous fingers 2 [Musca autumnalis]|uniref:nervous fingers 2 n=1 Tax=Musca autumnalis TaxID=221902 RepID=UPI003CF5F06C